MKKIEEILSNNNIKPTSNRVLVFRALVNMSAPVGLMELESILDTLERSSILRVLNLLLENHLVHSMEDGRGVVKYEVCRDHFEGEHARHEENEKDTDLHPHFYCIKCQRTYCLPQIELPAVNLPTDYEITSINFMVKGICPNCKS